MAPPTHIAPVFKNSPGDIFWKQFIFWYESQQGYKASFLYVSCVYLLRWVTICGLVTILLYILLCLCRFASAGLIFFRIYFYAPFNKYYFAADKTPL